MENFPHTVYAELTGLQPGATYHYRLAANIGNGVETGPDESFTEVQTQGNPGVPINLYAAEPSSTQAGGHPNITTVYFNPERNKLGFPGPCFCQDPENVLNQLPTGVIGDPHAVPYCTLAQLSEHRCPPDSQVGYLWNVLYEAFFFSPIYNVEPDSDQAGLLGFEFPFTNSSAFIELSSRTGSDYGLNATVKGISQIVPPEGAQLTLWGFLPNPLTMLIASHLRHIAAIRTSRNRKRKSSGPALEPGRSPPPARSVPRQPDCLRRNRPPRLKCSPTMGGSANSSPPTPLPPAAISSPLIPASRPSRPPPRPTHPRALKSTSASPRTIAPKPPRLRRSAP